MDLKNPDYAKSVTKEATKIINDGKKKKQAGMPVEAKMLLQTLPKSIIGLVAFVVIEALLGVGTTLYGVVKLIQYISTFL